jgi:hypothetical protein
MERPCPEGNIMFSKQEPEALLHLAGCFVGKGEAEYSSCIHTLPNKVPHPMDNDPGLA